MEQKERENCERIQKLESVVQNLKIVVQEKKTIVVQNQKQKEDLTAKIWYHNKYNSMQAIFIH